MHAFKTFCQKGKYGSFLTSMVYNFHRFDSPFKCTEVHDDHEEEHVRFVENVHHIVRSLILMHMTCELD